MNTLFRLTIWIWKAWPIIIVAILICLHLQLLDCYPQYNNLIHKTVSLVSQLLGGVLILYSLDSNIGIVNQKTLVLLKAYFRDFPLVKKSVTIEAQGLASSVSIGKADATVVRNPKYIEERIEYLETQIKELKLDVQGRIEELNARIEQQSKEIEIKTQKIDSAILNLESKIKEISIGSLKFQLLGALLMLYGAISGYIA
ncbi:MAG: hypothetical protein KGN35_09210 [Betaproteobacteria bacterium]|nr:hypothetical protein [Betaproteobacteria bacterium]